MLITLTLLLGLAFVAALIIEVLEWWSSFTFAEEWSLFKSAITGDWRK